MGKQNDQNPNNLFIVLIPFFRRAIDEHSNPEDRAEHTKSRNSEPNTSSKKPNKPNLRFLSVNFSDRE